MQTPPSQPPSTPELITILHRTLSKQHNWTLLTTHGEASALSLPLLSGLPPTRLYTSPTAQAAYLKARSAFLVSSPLERTPEWEAQKEALERAYFRPGREFVAACWRRGGAGTDDAGDAEEGVGVGVGVSMARIAATFEVVDAVVRGGRGAGEVGGGEREPLRLVLGIVDSDSTVVFYVLHDGIVKARQN